MPVLNGNKPILLEQVKRKATEISVEDICELVKKYDDLSVTDLKGCIDDSKYADLEDAMRNPEEVALWQEIETLPRLSSSEIQTVQYKVADYKKRFADGPKSAAISALESELQTLMVAALKREEEERRRLIEQKDWESLDITNYSAMQAYKSRYPESAHLAEMDEKMWEISQRSVSEGSLRRYLNDWPQGLHANEANIALRSITEWDEVKNSKDLIQIDIFRHENASGPFSKEAESLYWTVRAEVMEKMKRNPSAFDREEVETFMERNIFSFYDLESEGLLTQSSWPPPQRDHYPNLQTYQQENPNIQAVEDCTDIYLFGTPGTGKTCLLMGLTGADGDGYSLNFKVHGGPYAAALQEYVNAGITPGRTFGKYVSVINGSVREKKKSDKIVNHPVNFVEMSGEEFAIRIADGNSVSLADMGTGATNLLANDNRKVFFIIVDGTGDRVKFEYEEEVKDIDGNVIAKPVKTKYLSQLSTLNKFMGFFELPENQEIMSKVDAIHFIVTKSDTLGDRTVRDQKARELLQQQYSGPVEKLKDLCRESKRINRATRYSPHVFTFSLGSFHLGDVFSFDNTDTLEFVNAIREMTAGRRSKTFLDKLKEGLS